MKVLFLDVDGVLNDNNTETKTTDGYTFVDDKYIERLKRIIIATNARIVLSSDWRYGYYRRLKIPESGVYYTDLENKLKEFGLEIYSHTANNAYNNRVERGQEILNYVKEHQDEIEQWVALDDMYWECEILGEHYVNTAHDSLTEEHMNEAIAILNKE